MDRKIRIEQHGSLGIFWFMGWLFSIGFLGLGFWRGALALIVWPYFLGVHFSESPPATSETVAMRPAARAETDAAR